MQTSRRVAYQSRFGLCASEAAYDHARPLPADPRHASHVILKLAVSSDDKIVRRGRKPLAISARPQGGVHCAPAMRRHLWDRHRTATIRF